MGGIHLFLFDLLGDMPMRDEIPPRAGQTAASRYKKRMRRDYRRYFASSPLVLMALVPRALPPRSIAIACSFAATLTPMPRYRPRAIFRPFTRPGAGERVDAISANDAFDALGAATATRAIEILPPLTGDGKPPLYADDCRGRPLLQIDGHESIKHLHDSR